MNKQNYDFILAESDIMPHNICSNLSKAAFTLAEVLITLGVIGIVAALTMPALITKYQDRQTITKVKKAYSVLSQAYKMAQLENGENPEDWDCSAFEEYSNMSKYSNCYSHYISKYIKSARYCEMQTPYKYCLGGNTTVCTIDGSKCDSITNGSGTNFVMADGIGVYLRGTAGMQWIVVKTDNKENILNQNIFNFRISPEGLSTILYKEEFGIVTQHNLTSESLKQGIISGVNQSGSHWIMTTGNIDYLHCDGLSLKGKTSCK